MTCASQRRCLLLSLLLTGPLACSEVAVTAVDVARVEIEPATPTLVAGQSMTLRANLLDGSGNSLTGRAVAWQSSDPSIVQVDEDGRVTGVIAGIAQVTAAAEGQHGASTVTVLQKSVASVDIEPAAIQLVVSESAPLSASPKAGDGETLADRAVEWRTENPAVAAVDAAGFVTAVAPGSTRVLAIAEGVTGAAAVTVSPKPVAAVQLTPAQLSLQQGDTARFAVVLRAADGTPLTARAVTWRSEDGAVAQVESSGRILAVGAGSTRVFALSEGVEGEGAVQVTLRPVATVIVTPPSATITVGAVAQLHVALLGSDGSTLTGRTIQWSSNAPGIAQIDALGRVTGTGAGTATITATAEGVNGTSTILVQLAPVASVAVTPPTVSLKPGDTQQFVATLRAADGTLLTGRAIAWTTSDAAVLTTDAQGLATAVAAGTATVTAAAEGIAGQATATITPTVVPVAKVTVSPASTTLATGGVQQFTATTTAADGSTLTGRAVTWTSSNVLVLLIDAQGRAAALLPGAVTVTATSEGVAGTASVTVTITPPPPVPVANVTVTPAGVRLLPGATQQFSATARDATGNVITGRAVTWSTASATILTVTALGLATAAGQGTTDVTATVGGVTGQVTVTVDPPPPPPPPTAATVRVIPSFALVRNGSDVQLQAEVRAADGTILQKTVTWDSSDSRIANVTSKGLVKTKRSGTVTITATVDGKTDTALIVILP